MNTSIYMIRHAESPYTFGAERDRGLSAAGEDAAKRVAVVLKDTAIHYIASSPYARAIRTVHDLAESKGLIIHQHEELFERSISGIKTDWETAKAAIRESFTNIDFALEGGETTRQAQQRSVPVIKRLLRDYKGKSIAIGTHGNIMTIIINYFDSHYGYEFWSSTSMPDIYKLEFDNEALIQVERMWKEC